MSARNNRNGCWTGCSRIVAGLVVPLMLSACAVGPDFVRPEAPAVNRYTSDELPGATVEAEGKAQRFRQGEKIAADWWRLFNSSEIDAAVKQGLANNPNLQSAQASLRISQNNLQAGYGVFYPSIDLGFSATRQKLSPFRFGLNTPGSIFNLFTLGATVTYALDVFGGNRRTLEGLGAQSDYQRYSMLGTYMTLTGNIVNTMIARAAYEAQMQATEQLIGAQQGQLSITRIQVSSGTVPYANVLSINNQIAVNQAALPALQQKRDQAEHLLATLMGRLPAEEKAPPVDLSRLSLPHDLPASLPSDLVRQRPDILAAEAQLHAASANVGVATAALFPSFSLSGDYNLSSTHIGSVSDPNGRFWSVGPSVNYSLFRGGATWYGRQAALEGYQKSLADYRQTVLSAFQQVADTLKALQHDAEILQAQSEALSAAQEALAMREANYQAGLVSYLDVLVANSQFYQAKTNYLQALAQRYQDTTALFVALGGGWWNDKQLVQAQASETLVKKEEQAQ